MKLHNYFMALLCCMQLNVIKADEIIIDETTDQEIEMVLRKLDDEFKEGLGYFASLIHSLVQVAESKTNNDKTAMINGMQQAVQSIAELITLGDHKTGFRTIKSQAELEKIIWWLIYALKKPITRRALQD